MGAGQAGELASETGGRDGTGVEGHKEMPAPTQRVELDLYIVGSQDVRQGELGGDGSTARPRGSGALEGGLPTPASWLLGMAPVRPPRFDSKRAA